ncbi:flavin-containing monooxygenase [Rhodococcus sp. LB1]|uniref:flavin-containing monooxygenase n=1 Tax=Rhodococcus sp. LB1 TaxID=1807499 RepID=UPI00077B1911|nr:NAD(P)/FAD-dependent oxidoreductase [Rhodococcus sp. LB1]KXX54137.1 cyclohexanone monooxygenase [Rhodococcus sp. LB1]
MTTMPFKDEADASISSTHDVVVVGAGFSGLYMLHKLREQGLSVLVLEAATDVGGTWYWNRYPGARTDSESYYYAYSFSPELAQEWEWSERYSSQPELLKYLSHVADRFDLRTDISFNTRLHSAVFDEDANVWRLTTESGQHLTTTFLVTALGVLSQPNLPPFKGIEKFKGETYHTARWPHEPVDFSGKRVGVIGTGSSGVQAIPQIARQASELVVFQRTPNFVVPSQNHPTDPEFMREIKERYSEVFREAREHWFAVPLKMTNRMGSDFSPTEQQEIFEAGWKKGGFRFLFETFDDVMFSPETNELAAEFIRSKIREIVKDSEVAELLSPRDHPYGSKRPPVGTEYYETYNLDHVSLVDVRKAPIQEITEGGVRTADKSYELDAIVFATGFDVFTGALNAIDIRGREGQPLQAKWESGSQAYLGLATSGFPNMLMVTGPGCPFTNLPVCIEENVEWIAGCIDYVRKNGVKLVESTEAADKDWLRQVEESTAQTLVPLGENANSWLLGANIDGKHRGPTVYFGGADKYFQICDEVAENGYEGFELLK